MITLQCCDCGRVWRHFGWPGGRRKSSCPDCASQDVMRIGKRRGSWQPGASPCDQRARARQHMEEVWQRTAPRGQTHKGKGRG